MTANEMTKRNTTTNSVFAWSIPLIIVASYGLLAIQGNVRESIPVLVGATAVIVSALSLALYAMERYDVDWSPSVILLVAGLVRALFVLRPPELSDDIYRYLWDGLQSIHGNNPYALPPAVLSPAGDFSAILLKNINHPELVTIYPPAAQILFAIGAALSPSVIGLKAILCAIDLASCAMIIALLATMRQPPGRSVLYAWHPLPVIEIAASGHIDGAGIFFLLIAVYCVLDLADASGTAPSTRGLARACGAGVSLGTAALTKLSPILFFPFFFLTLRGARRWLFVTGLMSALFIFTVPFVYHLRNLLTTVCLYLRHWEFSNILFRLSRDFLSSDVSARILLWSSFSVFMLLLTGDVWKKLKRINENRHTGDLTAVRSDTRDASLDVATVRFRSLYAITIAFLLCNPTLHPWYALWLVCLFPFYREPAGMVLSWTVFLSYYVIIGYAYLGEWIENTFLASFVWIGPAVAFIVGKIFRR